MTQPEGRPPQDAFAWATPAPNSPKTWAAAIAWLAFAGVIIWLQANGVGVDGLRTLIEQAGWWAPWPLSWCGPPPT